MREDLKNLYRLQQIDRAILDARRAMSGLDDGQALIAEAKRSQATLKQRSDELSKRQVDLVDAELELKRVEEKLDKTRHLLHSGRVTNPRELSGLQKEVAALERARGNLDERVLVAMDDVERLKAETAQLDRDLEQRKNAIREVVQEYRKRVAALESRLRELEQRRQIAAASVSEGLIKRYEAVRNHLDGIGIVDVSGGVCGGCHMPVGELVLREVRAMNKVVTCDNCTRILYLAEEE